MYSQYGEDDLVLEILKERGMNSAALMFEIGAWNPVDKSNSRALIEAGWSAVLVEPSPSSVRRLVGEYEQNPKVEIIAAAVSPSERGLVKLNVTDDAVSTSSAAVHETWLEIGGYYGTLWVPQITPSDLVMQFGAPAVASIDTEGTSVEVTLALLQCCTPFVLIVEHDERIIELMQGARDYAIHHANGTNVVMVRKS